MYNAGQGVLFIKRDEDALQRESQAPKQHPLFRYFLE